MNIESIIEKVEYIFDRYRWRSDIEEALEDLGFKLWANLKDEHGKEHPDEQLWAYDRGVPNGQVLVLINWVDGFYWIYRKVDRGSLI